MANESYQASPWILLDGRQVAHFPTTVLRRDPMSGTDDEHDLIRTLWVFCDGCGSTYVHTASGPGMCHTCFRELHPFEFE